MDVCVSHIHQLQMLRNIEHKAPLIKIPSFVVGKSKDQDSGLVEEV